MKKILTLSILSIISSPSYAEETKTLFGNQNLSPVFCQLNATAKTPSCVISIGAEAGTKLSSSIVIQKKLPDYIDDSSPNSSNFETNDNYTVNPLVGYFSSNGTKQIRAIYKGTITPEMTQGEIYGRLLLKLEKNGQPVIHNLPLFFKTTEGQKEQIDNIKLVNLKIETSKGLSNAVALSIHNSGNGIASYSMIGINGNSNPEIKNDFVPFNGNILPNSTSKVIITNSKVVDYFKQNPKFVYFINKRTLLIEKINISNN